MKPRASASTRGLLACLAIGALAPITAGAAVFTVGSPSGPGQACSHGTIQSAIQAAESGAGADTVRLTRSLTYEPEAITITTSQELTVEGGYATCTQANGDGQRTVVSGAGGITDPVFRITANTGGIVRLRNLTISGGDEDGSGRGGGIYFRGNGILEIRDSLITQNVAGHGGGIYAEATGSDTELVIGANVVISNNTARYNGGGIVADQLEMSMVEPGSSVLGNEALGIGGSGGFGGGLYLRAGNRPGYATIASGGAGGVGAIVGNVARYGGGVAVGGSGDNGDSVAEAVLRMYTRESTRPARLRGNTASVAGGALHLQSSGGSFVAQVAARAQLWNVVLDDDRAPEGAVAQVIGNDPPLNFPGLERATLYLNGSGWPADATPCPIGAPCGRIEANIAEDIGGNATGGAVLRITTHAAVLIGDTYAGDVAMSRPGIAIHANRGGRLYDANGLYPMVSLRNTLVTDNQFSQQLGRIDSNVIGNLRVRDTTIAANAIGGATVQAADETHVTIERSVLWQPGTVMLSRNKGTQSVAHVIASEVSSLGGGSSAILVDPRFTDPTRADFSLRAASPAIDRAPIEGSSSRDTLGGLRVVDLPLPANTTGTRDIGALERQLLQPLVLNADFDFADLRLWSYFAGAWDGTQNASGGSGSGSWAFSTSGQTASRFVVGQQCIHLPGPGRYRLNGRGKGGGNTMISRDYAVLGWEFRRNGSEACTSGSADAAGELGIGSGANWGSAAQPALIDVPAADWTASSSIVVRLIAVDGGVSVGGSVSAWFDGITLDVEGSDVIFRNGFDPG